MSVALIGGIDPTGGAGLVRDQWAIESFARAHAGRTDMGVPGLVIAPSAWTWQGEACEPARAQPLTARAFARALVRVAEMAPRVIKIGLVPAQLIEPLVQWLGTQRARPQRVHVILDPVLRASDGGALGASVEGLWALIGSVDLVTPNRGEALALLGAHNQQAGGPLGAQLRLRSGSTQRWLIKSALTTPQEVHDELWGPEGKVSSFRHTRVDSPDPRGTGCALASAIACALWQGFDELAALRAASAWLGAARRHTRLSTFGQPHMCEPR